MKYKLIALDVDGTLLTDEHELTQATAEVIRAAAAEGAEIVLCTGRAPQSSIPYMQRLGLEGSIITHNGAATVGVQGNEYTIIHEFPLEQNGLQPYFDYCRENGVHFDVNTTFELYVPGVDQLSQDVLDMYKQFMISPKSLPAVTELTEPVVKVTAAGTKELMDKVEADWRLWEQPFNMLRSGDYFVDLMHKESSKGAALRQLAEKHGINRENIMAIGNFYNDISMLTYAGLGIAMENSPLDVKAAANEVTLSNNEEGVKAALEKYCLNRAIL